MILQLSSDDGSEAELDASNTKAINAIERASAMVQSYAMRGGRYTAVDLDDIQTADDWTLKGLVASLAMSNLYRRRGSALPEDLKEQVKEAHSTLKALSNGDIIFAQDTASITAGKPETVIVPAGRRAELGLMSDQPIFPKRRGVE